MPINKAVPGPFLAPMPAAFYDDIFVGCVACRVEGEGSSKKLYMMILAVLAPYRSRGIGE